MKKGYLFFGSLVVLILLTNLYAGEVKVTTYYPAPYGRYDTVHTNKIGVGSSLTSTDLSNLSDGEIRVTGADAGPYWGSGWGNAITLPKNRIILWEPDTMMGVTDAGGVNEFVIQDASLILRARPDYTYVYGDLWAQQRLYFCAW